jgi:hypothetical protein
MTEAYKEKLRPFLGSIFEGKHFEKIPRIEIMISGKGLVNKVISPKKTIL